MVFDFGQYEGEEVRDVVENDRKYAEWLLNRIQKKEKLQELSNEIRLWLEELEPQELDPEEITFGKYKGYRLSEFMYQDKSYCKWLLEKSNLKKENPETYELLKRRYHIFYVQQEELTCCFYILTFVDKPYVKVGVTTQTVLKRIYNYTGSLNFYSDHNIDYRKSFAYKTNNLDIEDIVLSHFEQQRIDSTTERIGLPLSEIEEFLFEKEKEDKGTYFYLKKPIHDFIPFDTGNDLRRAFRMKVNEYQDFETNYERHLEELGLLDEYTPEFYAISQYKN